MCGICFSCSLNGGDDQLENSKKSSQFSQNINLQNSLLPHRGPDASSCSEISISGNLKAQMLGCVLHLRGDLTPQPVTNPKGNALLWNGEIFGGTDVKDKENDTQVLFDLLDSTSSQESVLQIFQKIDGPWAFIFWQSEAKTLWFGRDMFGRRSLLWHLPVSSEDNFVLSSVAVDEKVYNEIPSVGIFSMNFSDVKDQTDCLPLNVFSLPPIVLHPWLECRWPGTNLHVNKTPAKNLMEYFYPNSRQSEYSFLLSQHGINRWIPTQCTILSESNDVQDNGCKSQSELLSTSKEQTQCSNSSSISGVGNLQKNEHDIKSACSGVVKDFEEVLQEIWDEQKDLHVLVKKCLEALQEAVETRVRKLEQRKRLPSTESSKEPSHESPARIAVLFSGGLDSTLLAALVDRCLPEEEPIDLLNVAFEQPVPQQHTGKQKKPRKHNKKSNHQIKCEKESYENDPEVACSYVTDQLAGALYLPGHEACLNEEIANKFHLVESNLVVDKIEDSTLGHTESKNATNSYSSKANCSVSVSHSIPKAASVFSATNTVEKSSDFTGSTTVASTTATENHNLRSSNLDSKEASLEKRLDSNFSSAPTFDTFDVPDRQTGRVALSELNPRRKWNFVEINISQAELESVRQSRISRLIYPLRTVLDDSIGCAVWFAARGKGFLNSGTAGNGHQAKQIFQSRAQVLLCGMAADELFAGYSRHRATFNKEGWAGLEKEIQEELWRISARNLGRDDRIIADHGKEARFPFLDEKFVHLVSEIPLQKRVDLSYPRGIGEKLLLRLCALNLGLARTACQAKRAIQFGSKIAKLDNRKEKGSDVCERLL